MNDQPSRQFRGRVEGTVHRVRAGDPGDPGETWGWSGTVGDRPRLPVFGLFLVLFGGLLLVEQLVPAARTLGSGIVVALGVAILIASFVNRRPWQLYVGGALTALSLPALLQDLDIIDRGSGWGLLFLGLAFLVITVIRVGERGGIGWQFILGAIFTFLGGSQVAAREIPSVERLFWPVLILGLGLVLVFRAARRRIRSPRR